MILSLDHTWVPSSRVAMLPKDVIQRLWEKYPYFSQNGVPWHIGKDTIEQMNRTFSLRMRGKEDLVTEWALKSLHNDNGRYTSDMGFFVELAQFYFDHHKEQRFKDAVQRVGEHKGKTFSSKNLLDFLLSDLYAVSLEYEKPTTPEPPLDPRVLPEKLPDGAFLIYDADGYQILEIHTMGTACDLARDTRWCTKNPAAAGSYLDNAPLYIIYKDKRRVAQFHPGGRDEGDGGLQLMNLKNEPMTPDQGMIGALIGSGLMDEVMGVIHRLEDPETALLRWTGNVDRPYFRKRYAHDAQLAYYYSVNVLGKKRFPEGEAAIASDPNTVLAYVRNVIKQRWPAGERLILSRPGMKHYYEHVLEEVDPAGLADFQREAQEAHQERQEREYREMGEEV